MASTVFDGALKRILVVCTVVLSPVVVDMGRTVLSPLIAESCWFV